MPAAPKDDGLSRRTGPPVRNKNGTELSATFLPPQREHWTTDARTANYDVIPVEYYGSAPARDQAPFLAPNEQSYLLQDRESLDASNFTNNRTATGVVTPNPLLGSFHSPSTNHPGFDFNASVDPFQQHTEASGELAQTQSAEDDHTTSLSYPKHLRVIDKPGVTTTGPRSPLALSAAGKGSQWPAPALPRSSLARKGDYTSSSRGGYSTAHPTGWRRQIERTKSYDRMSNRKPLPGTSGHSSADTGSRDQRPAKTTESISSDAASGSGAEVETNGSEHGMAVTAQPAEPNVGANQPRDSSQTRRAQPDQHARVSLPAEKVFPIQIGSELFRLSGASIASDGQYSTCITTVMILWQIELTMLEHPRTSPSFSRINCAKTRMVPSA